MYTLNRTNFIQHPLFLIIKLNYFYFSGLLRRFARLRPIDICVLRRKNKERVSLPPQTPPLLNPVFIPAQYNKPPLSTKGNSLFVDFSLSMHEEIFYIFHKSTLFLTYRINKVYQEFKFFFVFQFWWLKKKKYICQ